MTWSSFGPPYSALPAPIFGEYVAVFLSPMYRAKDKCLGTSLSVYLSARLSVHLSQVPCI